MLANARLKLTQYVVAEGAGKRFGTAHGCHTMLTPRLFICFCAAVQWWACSKGCWLWR